MCMSMDPIPRIFGETANVIFCTCVSAHMPFQLRLKGKLMCVLTITRFIVVAPFGKIFLKVPPPCQLYCSVVQLPHIPCSLGIAHKYIWFVRSPSAFITVLCALLLLLCDHHHRRRQRASIIRARSLSGGHFRLHQQTQTNCIVCPLAFH